MADGDIYLALMNYIGIRAPADHDRPYVFLSGVEYPADSPYKVVLYEEYADRGILENIGQPEEPPEEECSPNDNLDDAEVVELPGDFSTVVVTLDNSCATVEGSENDHGGLMTGSVWLKLVQEDGSTGIDYSIDTAGLTLQIYTSNVEFPTFGQLTARGGWVEGTGGTLPVSGSRTSGMGGAPYVFLQIGGYDGFTIEDAEITVNAHDDGGFG